MLRYEEQPGARRVIAAGRGHALDPEHRLGRVRVQAVDQDASAELVAVRYMHRGNDAVWVRSVRGGNQGFRVPPGASRGDQKDGGTPFAIRRCERAFVEINYRARRHACCSGLCQNRRIGRRRGGGRSTRRALRSRRLWRCGWLRRGWRASREQHGNCERASKKRPGESPPGLLTASVERRQQGLPPPSDAWV